ncbi:MAG TPA: SRPBCC family protein [bacterium]|nr:SRPBCC family protein [bacterium]
MGKIKTKHISRAPVEKLYSMGKQVHNHTNVLPSLKKIDIMEVSDDGKIVVAQWTAQARLITKAYSMSWVQKDVWDEDSMSCSFSCVDNGRGRFKYLNGYWHFAPHKSGTEMTMDVDFEIDHPLMTPMVSKLIDGIMKKNNESLLKELSKIAEKD